MTYGARLRELRAERQLSLREVAERGGPNKDTMSLIERGVHKPQPQTLGRIAKALGVGVADLRSELEAAEHPLASAPPSPTQPPLNGFEEERRSLTAYELNAAHALDAFCSQLEEFIAEFLPENDDTPLGENLLNMQRYMARTAAALSLPYMESATMRPVMLPAATRFVELVRTLEEAAENSGAGADEQTGNVVQIFELALAS